MKRRWWMAATVLGLLLAAVVIAGPGNVWDVLTWRSVERHYPDGQPRLRYRVRRWAPDDVESYGPREFAMYAHTFEAWHPNGQRAVLLELRPSVQSQQWTEDGTLVGNYIQRDGQITGVVCNSRTVNGVPRKVEAQVLYAADRVLDQCQPPTWFTEKVVRNSIDGVLE